MHYELEQQSGRTGIQERSEITLAAGASPEANLRSRSTPAAFQYARG
jgi:hypothetical protein